MTDTETHKMLQTV